MTRRTTLLLVALSLVAIAIGSVAVGVAVAEDDGQLTTIDNDHELDNETAIAAFESDGVATADLRQIDGSITVATAGEDVEAGAPIGADATQDYLRINYREGITRTLRVWIPAEFVTPYTRETVQSKTTSHVADFQPVRDGKYLQVTITLHDKADVVLPLSKSASASYDVIERVDERISTATSLVTGGNAEWQYIDGDSFGDAPAHPVEANASETNIIIQFDATPNAQEETWVNAQRGETRQDPVYYFVRESEDRQYIVVKGDSPPDVRVKEGGSRVDRVKGDINEIKHGWGELLDGGIPFLGDEEGDS